MQHFTKTIVFLYERVRKLNYSPEIIMYATQVKTNCLYDIYPGNLHRLWRYCLAK